MSQYRPTVVEVTASTDAQRYQDTAPALTEDKPVTVADVGKRIRALSAMEPLLRTKLLPSPWILARNRWMFSCESAADAVFAVD
jgi:hypothetical protein